MCDMMLDQEVRNVLWTCDSCVHALPTITKLGKTLQGVKKYLDENPLKPSFIIYHMSFRSMQQLFVWPTGLTHIKAPKNTILCRQACNSSTYTFS